MIRLRFLFLLTVFSACTVSKKDDSNSAFMIVANSNDYQPISPTVSERGVEIGTLLKSDMEKGALTLLMHIANDGDQSIRIDYSNCGLSIDAERVAIPEVKNTFKAMLEPGESWDYEIQYYPINTVDFYFRSDYRGDMKQQYRLKLDFITDMHGTQVVNTEVVFKLSDDAYQRYLSANGRERHMQIFDFGFDGEVFAEKQRQYLQNILPENPEQPHAVLALTPSITMDQLIVNTYAYQYKDTLTINMRMLNQGGQSIKVLLAKARITMNGKTFPLSKHFSDSFQTGRLPDSTFIFKPGTRLQLLLKFRVPPATNEFQLTNDFLLVHTATDEWKNLFFENLRFEESIITKDIL